LEYQDYPRLYRASDSSAINAEKRQFQLVQMRIALLLITAGVSSVAWSQLTDYRVLAGAASASFLVILMALSAFMDSKKFDRVWFNSRAVAESVKKETWSFMMKAEPYNSNISEEMAEKRFLDRLKEILDRQRPIFSELSSSQQGPEITGYMRQMRQKKVENRKTCYVQERIRDQKDWYAIKAKSNQARASLWYAITWILQVVAVIGAFIIISLKDFVINPVGILTTAGAGVLSWTNARSYQELSQSYGFITHELSLLEAHAEQALTEEKLAEIVSEVETATSREHTIWLERRLV